MFNSLKLQWPISRVEQPQQMADPIRTLDEITALIDLGYYGGGATAAARRINVKTAMRQATVWACIRIISEIIAQLPITVQVRESGHWREAEDHDILGVISSPNDWQTQHDLISTLIMWSEGAGNGYLFKVANSRGRVIKLLPIESSAVNLTVNSDWSLTYEVGEADKQGLEGRWGQERIFHLRNFGSEGYKGLSTIGNHREGIGLAVQLEQHAASAYENGLQSKQYLYSEKRLGSEALESLKKAIGKLSGSTNSGKMPVFHGGVELKDVGVINMTDAQYIESRRMQQQQIASIFGVPMFLLNDTEKSTTWGTGLEQFTKAFTRFSLGPRMNRLGQTLVKELVPPAQRQRTRVVFDTDQFTLGEFKERMDGYKSGIEAGVISPNEARDKEGMNPRDDGDDYRIPKNIGKEGESMTPQELPDRPSQPGRSPDDE